MKKSTAKTSRSWIHPALFEKWLGPSIGYGLFTSVDIAKNTLLVVTGGDIYSVYKEKTLPKRIRDTGHMISPELVIGPRTVDRMDLQDYVNHSCEPNCGCKGQIYFVAMRNIAAGEQITIDYAMVAADIAGFQYALPCKCGSKKCRGQITSADWKKKVLQSKYTGYFQWYIEDVILNKKPTILYPSSYKK